MLNKIVIKKLFGLYDYSIDWKDSAIKDLLFITGPNGMGKTTILRMISMLSSFSPEFYERIKFQEATFWFDGGQMLKLCRTESSPKQDIKTDIPAPKTVLLKCEFKSSSSVLSSELCGWEFVEHKLQKVYGEEMTNMRLFLQTESCRFLQDVRIFSDFNGEYEKACKNADVIKEKLAKLQIRLEDALMYDDSLRVENEKKDINKRVKNVRATLELLNKCEIKFDKQDLISSNANVEDEDFIRQLVRFEKSFNENIKEISLLRTYLALVKRFGFTDKELRLAPRFGYRFVQSKTGEFIDFEDLSSGEKHILCLLNGLFFVKVDSPLVLIDEPELSFHLYWQMQFCWAMKKVVKELGFRVLVATHSAQIFDGDFSLTTDLYKQNSTN